jgi:ArsR family transcriptional regulator
MIDKLSEGEKCVCEFVNSLDIDFSTISKHLSVLKEAGIAESEKHGKQVFYRLSMPCVLNFVSCVEKAVEYNVEKQVSLLD